MQLAFMDLLGTKVLSKIVSKKLGKNVMIETKDVAVKNACDYITLDVHLTVRAKSNDILSIVDRLMEDKNGQ